jgi:hypothetical protein
MFNACNCVKNGRPTDRPTGTEEKTKETIYELRRKREGARAHTVGSVCRIGEITR